METLPGQLVLVTEITGYVGRRLVSRLLAESHRVRVLARGRPFRQGSRLSGRIG